MKKRLLLFLSLLLFFLVTFMIILPGILVRYLTEHSEELTGRQFVIGDIDLNYFTGSIDVEDFIMFEENEQDTFISIHELYIELGVIRTLSGKLSIDDVLIRSPFLNIEQDSSGYNFDDIIAFFDSTGTADIQKGDSEPMKYQFRNIRIEKGEFKYTLKGINSTVGFLNIETNCPEINSDMPEIEISNSFDFLHGGTSELDVILDLDASTFVAYSNIDSLNLKFMESIMTGIMNVTAFKGYASSELDISGNYKNIDVINASGNIRVDDFDLRGPDNVRTVYFDSYEMRIDTAEIGNATFDIEYMKLDSFYTLFELYENDNNFDRMLGIYVTETADSSGSGSTKKDVKLKSGGLDENTAYMVIAKAIMDYFKGYSISQYNIGRMELTRSSVTFRDHTLHDEFEYRITNMYVSGDDINSKADSIQFNVECTLNESGKLLANFSLDPSNIRNLDLHYAISDLKVYDFSPYSRHYVAYPIMGGELLFKCDIKIENGFIENYNYVQINDFDFGGKDDIKPVYKLPVKLASGLLKDNKGVIKLKVPVTGDMNDPDFHYWKSIMNVLKNIVIKVAESPYKLVSGFFEKDEDASQNIYLSYGSDKLEKGYKKSIRGINTMCDKKPEINFEFILMTDSVNDLRTISVERMMVEFLEQTSDNDEDTKLKPETIEATDSVFVSYVNKRIDNAALGSSIEEKCMSAIKDSELASAYNSLNQSRVSALQNALAEADVPLNRYNISIAKHEGAKSKPGIPKFQISYVTGTESTIKVISGE